MANTACLVLPTYNEAEAAKIIIPLIFAQTTSIPTHELHVVVVDDNSPDRTADVVRHLMPAFPNLHLISGEKKGLGEAYKRGLRFALDELHPNLVFQMDADLQHDPSLLPRFVELSNEGFDLVIGSRFLSGGATPDFPWYRKAISVAGTWLVRHFAGLPEMTDCTSGYRCIKADVLAKCDLTGLATRGYSFQSSLLAELVRRGARLVEVPIVFESRQSGESKLSLRDQIEFVFNLIKLRSSRPAPARLTARANFSEELHREISVVEIPEEAGVRNI
jgi:dolichol-phosphate mannosyltransferase